MQQQPLLLLQTPSSHAGRFVRALAFVVSHTASAPHVRLTTHDDALVQCSFESTHSRAEFLAKLRQSFVFRHTSRIFQVDRQSASVAEAVAAFTAGSSKEHVYRLVAFPKATEEELGDQIPVHVQLAVTGSTHVLAVARVAPDVVLWGVVPAKEHVPCAGASTPPQSALVSRAYWKLEEALVRHGIDCKGARALDIGAAPGGWSQCLVQMGAARVVAVDPAALLLPPSPTVVHLRLKLQDAMQAPALLAEAPFDLLVADMNIHPTESAGLMLLAAPLLKPGGCLFMTAKLVAGYSAAQDREVQLTGCMQKLASAFDQISEFWGLSNGNERTIFAVRRPALQFAGVQQH